MFTAVTESSMLGRATYNGILEVKLTDIRKYTLDKHNRTDDTPYGGGTGMVLSPEPVFRAIEAVGFEGKKMIYMSPRGKVLDRHMIEALSVEEEILILCGHYEGVDQRIIEHWNMEEVSIGDFVLTGGELPAMVFFVRPTSVFLTARDWSSRGVYFPLAPATGLTSMIMFW